MVVLIVILALYGLGVTGILLAVLAGANKELGDKYLPGEKTLTDNTDNTD